MSSGIQINDRYSIDPEELSVQFVRSPGPGGQNVNKVNSKAVVHWDLNRHQSLPVDVMDRLRHQAGNRINNEGCLVVSSHQSRSQADNLAFCYLRIRQIVLAALHVPRERKPTKVTRGAKQRRLKAKRQVSEKKHRRRGGDWASE